MGAERQKYDLAVMAAFVALVGAPPAAAQAVSQDTAPGLQQGVTFTGAMPLARSTELVGRMISPLLAAEMRRALSRSGRAMADQPVDPAAEKFLVYVPSHKPQQGYGVLVFVPASPHAVLPDGWGPVLDRDGVIFVSADRSGNAEKVLDRRVPLALIAAQGVVQHYDIDPRRVFIAGMSGGSRVAMRIALGYPDVFHGALLNSGSDPLGTPNTVLPSAWLFRQFQETTRLVYLTGTEDSANLAQDARSMASMKYMCVNGLTSIRMLGVGHELADATMFSRALTVLLEAPPPATEGLDACRAGIDAQVSGALDQAVALLAAGKRDQAARLLADTDIRFGGLAAPRSLALGEQLEEGLVPDAGRAEPAPLAGSGAPL